MAKKQDDEAVVEEEGPPSVVAELGDQGLLSDDPAVMATSSGKLERISSSNDPAGETVGVPMTENAQALATEGTHDEEEGPYITVGTWVRLGQLTGDLERFSGREAYVTVAPMVPRSEDSKFSSTGSYAQTQPKDTIFTVKTRDDESATFQATAEDFAEISSIGRVGLTTAG